MKKLYGAAAKAHAKKLGKSKKSTRKAARKAAVAALQYGPAKPSDYGTAAYKKRTAKSRRRFAAMAGAATRKRKAAAAKRKKKAAPKKTSTKKASGGMSKSTKRSRAAKKAAATRKRNAHKRSLSAKKAARTRARGGKKAKTHHKRRKHAVAAKTVRRRRRRARRGGRPSTWKSLRRARKSIRNRRTTARGRAYKRRYHMRSNPGMGDVMALVKQLVPIAVGLYGGRVASSKLATANIPGLSSISADYRGVAMSGVVLVGAHFLTKFIKPLQKFRGGVMIGAGLNVLDQALMAFVPAGDAKKLLGLGDIYDTALNDYVQVSDYLQVGATPIDDDITLRDYVTVGALQEELGVEEELGLEEELGGALDRAYLGGVSQSSMMKRVPSQALLQAIPDRSFTKDIRHAGPGYDNGDVLYGGIFGGGF